MNKCFITKLPSSVDNDNLPVLGQLRINWLKDSKINDARKRRITLGSNDNITVKVSGAYFTNDTFTSNLGNTKTITAADGNVALYVSNDTNAVLTIDNKYSLTYISFMINQWDNVSKPIYFDLDDIKYCTNINTLGLDNTKVSGDISALSNLTKLTFLHLDGTQVSGDISVLSNFTNLDNLYLNDTQVSGDISALTNLTNLTMLHLGNTDVSGDISALLSNLTKLPPTEIDFSETNVVGDISKLVNISILNQTNYWHWTRGATLTGDMSKVPANVSFIAANKKSNFTWTANGRQNATLLAIMGVGAAHFDTASMDNMLIDQATCTFKPDNPNNTRPWTKVIGVDGTRTSASDAAVTAIQNMGVTITGVTKEG